MATEKTVWVLPDGRGWIDDANVPTAVTVIRTSPTTGAQTIVANVPINWAEIQTPQLPGLKVTSIPKLIEQAIRTLEAENGWRLNSETDPTDIVGVKITLRQP